MKYKIAIDNSSIDYFIQYADKNVNKILSAFKEKKVVFYPTVELFSEIIGLLDMKEKSSERLNKIFELSGFIYNFKYRFLRPWNEIIQFELGLNNIKSIFIDSTLTEIINDQLLILTKRNIPDDINIIIEAIKNQKKGEYDSYVSSKNKSLEYLRINAKKNDIKAIADIPLEKIYTNKSIMEWGRSLLKDILNKNGDIINENNIEKIMHGQERYPHFHTYIKLVVSENHRHIFKNQHVGMGDSYDNFQLLYLVGLDYFVSEDKNNKVRANSIAQINEKVINFKEFCKILN